MADLLAPFGLILAFVVLIAVLRIAHQRQDRH